MTTYTLKIIAITVESTNAITISFKQPALKKIHYYPGQYLTLIVNINNRKFKRPYSLSSAPMVDNTLNVTVKRMHSGIVSNHLIDVVKEGDLLEVIEPMGNFIYNTDIHSEKDVFLWGAGSGITPLMSIIKTALTRSEKKVTLFYCNKSRSQTIFYDQLMQLKEQYSSRFFLKLFCTAESQPNTTCGRIDELCVSEVLENILDKNNTIHYICGPLGLKETVKHTLTTVFAQDQIYSEEFEHIVNETELENIKTRFIEIIKDKENIRLEVIRGRSILEAGLAGQIDLPYSCQTGSCTLCKAKLLSGKVKKIGTEQPLIELEDNERLLCCSYPLDDNVKFEINS